MKKFFKYGINFVLVIFTGLLILSAIFQDKTQDKPSALDTAEILGTYSLNNANPQPFSTKTTVNVAQHNKVVITGSFNKDIEENKQMMLRTSNVILTLAVNGKEIYTNTPPKNSLTKTSGNGWAIINSPGIKVDDIITLTVSNIYTKGNPNTFSDVWQKMYIGYKDELITKKMPQYVHYLVFGFGTIFVGVFLFFVGIIIKQINKSKVYSLGLFSISVGLWMLLEPEFVSLFIDSPQGLVVIFHVFQYLILVSITKFICSIVEGKSKMFCNFLYIITLGFFIISSVFQMTGKLDYYEFTPAAVILVYLIVAFVPVVLLVQSMQKNTHAKKTLISLLPLSAFSLWEQLSFLKGNTYTGFYIAVGFLLFLSVQVSYIVKDVKNVIYRLENTQRIENEVLQSRISIMLSQIQPHFLYNTLGVIRELCYSNPALAEQATIDFSDFLRGNLDALSAAKPIPFEQELAHVNHYLDLEKLRLGEKLKVCQNIQPLSFCIPTLILQPIVENAVRYGISPKEQGGTSSTYFYIGGHTNPNTGVH